MFRRTTKIALGLVTFLLGLCLARFIDPGNYVLLTGICSVCVLIKKNRIVHITGILFLGLILGLWRGTLFMDRLQAYQDLQKKSVMVRAVAVSDAVYADKGQLSFDVGSVSVISPITQNIDGKIGVKGYGESMIYRGDKVQITAKLYPTRGSKQASLSYAKIERIRRGNSSLDRLRREFAAGLQSALPEPLGSFGLGILIGQRTTLPESLSNQLSTAGLTHIVAVSGYNLTIIVLAVHRLMKKRSKYQSTAFTLLLIGLFLALTGSSASIVRAAIVSILSLWAWYYGRRIKPLVLILLAASMTAGWFPPYLWSDIGWYLSFLAFTGVLVVAPLLMRRIKGAKEPKILSLVLIETFSAQLMTIPVIMYIFGSLSLISVVSNLLIVPLVPLAMLLSFIAGIGGMLTPAIAGWFAWPATVLMTYMLDVVTLMSAIPHASIMQKVNVTQLAILYLLILLCMLIWWRKTHSDGKIKKLKPQISTQKQLI